MNDQWPQIGDTGYDFNGDFVYEDENEICDPPYGQFPIPPDDIDEMVTQVTFVPPVPGEEKLRPKGFITYVNSRLTNEPRDPNEGCDFVHGSDDNDVFPEKIGALKNGAAIVRRYADAWTRVAERLESWIEADALKTRQP
jgi:hypothetical protein